MTKTASENLRHRLDRAAGRHDILSHPFYRAWVEGSLTRRDLDLYAGQYRHHVAAFPAYLEALAGRLHGPAEEAVRDNLADERDGDHLGLWDRFAASVGTGEPVESAPETDVCLASFRSACESAPAAFALGMIYGYESQTPAVAATKLEGLRERYGIGGEAASYFELHATLDVEHSNSLADAIAAVVETEDDRARAEEGAAAGAAAVWTLLDGVERVRAAA